MESYTLSTAEQAAVIAILRSQQVVFPIDGDENLSGKTLRLLMLGLLELPSLGRVVVPGTGICIKGAKINGPIELKHGRSHAGSPMPRLALEACQIRDAIHLESARIEHLCLINSQISELLADNIHIEGKLDLTGVHGFEPSIDPGASKWPSICRVSIRGAHIEDGIEAAYAKLVSPPAYENYARYSRRSEYALDLPEAKINGDIRLFPDFVATGGVNINGAVISGSFHAHGALFSKAQMYGFDASGAEVQGDLTLDTRTISIYEQRAGKNVGLEAMRFRCDGQLRLHNVSVGGDLRLTGADIFGNDGSISGEHCTIKGDIALCAYSSVNTIKALDPAGDPIFGPCVIPFECSDRIDLRGVTVSGDLDARGAKLAAAIDLSFGTIGGHGLFGPIDFYRKEKDLSKKSTPLVKRFEANGEVKIDGTKIKGNLSFEGALLHGELKARGVEVQGHADFSPYELRDANATTWPFTLRGTFKLDSTEIGRTFDLRGACLEGEVQGQNLRVGSKLLMCGFVPSREFIAMHWFDAMQRINLSGAVINGDFDLTGAKLEKGLRFRSGRVEGALIFDIVDGPSYNEKKPVRNSIDLFGAHVNILSDRSNRDYSKLGYGESYFLRLEGFTYGRFSNYRVDDESLGKEERDRRHDLAKGLIYKSIVDDGERKSGRPATEAELAEAARSAVAWESSPTDGLPLKVRSEDWLNFQYRKRIPTKVNYNPDPYNSLYKFYKRMGAQSTADEVLRHKLSLERTLKMGRKLSISESLSAYTYRFSFWLFDVVFGWGLAPLRATFFYTMFICAISLGIWHSEHDIKPMPSVESEGRPILILWNGVAQATHLTSATHSLGRGALCPGIIKPSGDDVASGLKAIGYSLQLAIPALSLFEKDECRLEAPGLWGWQLFKLLATVVGWIMTSITLLTWTGLFRRNVEP